MLPTRAPRRKPSSRAPFLPPCWDDQHPDFRRIDATLPAEHHARWLLAVVGRLDLQPLCLSYAKRGSQAYDPRLLLPFVLFMYAEGFLSPARWFKCSRYDEQAKWLLRGYKPSRAQLYAFRDRLAPFVDSWHQQLIAWAVATGSTSARAGSLDGTFVAALASRHRLLGEQRLDRRLLLLRWLVWVDQTTAPTELATQLAQLVELVLLAVLLELTLLCAGIVVTGLLASLLALLAMLGLLQADDPDCPLRLPSWVPRTAAGRQRVLRRHEAAHKRLTQRLQPLREKQKLSKKDQHTLKRAKVSLTDPEAALGWDKFGTFRPLYNVPLVQATDAPLTLAWDVLARNNDDGLLQPMMVKTKEQVGQYLQDVRVDGAFVTVGEAAWCEQEGITVYAPPARTPAAAVPLSPDLPAEQAAVVSPVAVPNRGAGAVAQLPKEAFRYEAEEGVYYCPEGKRLEEVSRTSFKKQGGMALPMVVYRAAVQDCRACPRQSGCTSAKRGRTVKRYEGEEALERLAERMKEPAARQAYRQRGQSVELGYADIKEHRGLRVFRCFGRKRAYVQAGLVILASNGLKIMAILQRRQNTQQPPPQQRVGA